MYVMNFGKVYHFGHRDVRHILDAPVTVEEKIDGSQFAFGQRDGELWCASKNKSLPLDTTDKLFYGAVQTAKHLHAGGYLSDGLIVRGEAVCAPRHNKLTYERVPIGNVVLFDVADNAGYVSREQLESVARWWGLEAAPTLSHGRLTRTDLDELVQGPSFLGKCQREGIVIKSADRRLRCKIVSDAFREKRRVPEPKGGSVADIVAQYRTEPRWDKAIQHLREAGELRNTPKDIPEILREISRDLTEECEDEIRAQLWPKIWKEIRKGVISGAAEYYLRRLDEGDS